MIVRSSCDSNKFFELMPELRHSFCFSPAIDSTNLEASRYLRSSANPEERIFAADLQNSGRGRLGRNWIAPSASGLLCTLLLAIELPSNQAFYYSASLALAVKQAALQIASTQVQLKWPNDLLRDGRKIGGILGELEKVNSQTWLILGFGLNLSLTEEEFIEAGISEKAANLSSSLSVPREELLSAILQNFNSYRAQLRTGIDNIYDSWSSALVTIGHRVKVLRNEIVMLDGVAVRVERDGLLVIEDDYGKLHSVQSGDVSIRLPDGRYSA